MQSYNQLSRFDLFCSTLALTFDTNNRLWPVHNIQAYFDKFSLIYVSKILTLDKLVKVILGAAFQKQKYELSLKSLWQLDVKGQSHLIGYSQLNGFDLLLDLDLWPRQQ